MAFLNFCLIDACGLIVGMVIFAYYHECDILKSSKIEFPEQIFPHFLKEHLSSQAGMQGLFLACLFSAVLSSVSSGLNSISTVLLECIINVFLRKDICDEAKTKWSKIACKFIQKKSFLLENEAIFSFFSKA